MNKRDELEMQTLPRRVWRRYYELKVNCVSPKTVAYELRKAMKQILKAQSADGLQRTGASVTDHTGRIV